MSADSPSPVTNAPAPLSNSAASFDPHRARPATLEWPFDGSERRNPKSYVGESIVVAMDGSPEADAAARVADAIASKLQGSIHAMSVVDTTPVPIPFPLDVSFAMAAETANGDIHRQQERDLRNRIAALLSHPIEWPTKVELGVPADAIAHEATRLEAALIVMGLRHRHGIDRVVHRETTLAVMRKAPGPVLGVVARAAGLPAHAVVAMDFTRASIQAAVATARLMSGGGRLTLAFVESMLEFPPGSSESVLHTLGLDAAFSRLTSALATNVLNVDHVILHHTKPASPSRVLLDHVEGAGVDLLAAGSVRHGRLDRIMLGSVSAELVRDATCSVLIVPPEA